MLPNIKILPGTSSKSAPKESVYSCNQCKTTFYYDGGTLKRHVRSIHESVKYSCDQQFSVATKLWRSSKLRRFLSEDPSSSSSLVHFQKPKNLRSFKDFRLKIAKILWENLTIFWAKLSEKFKKYVLFLKLWISIFPTYC